MRTFLLLLAFTLHLLAAEEPSQTAPLSVAGRKRLSQNLLVLDQNLQTTSSGIEITKKNIITLREELRELESLEKEYVSLQKKYQEHITSIEKELEKNAKALNELQKYIGQPAPSRMNSAAPVPTAEDPIRKALMEKSERERWKTETEEKIRKSQTLLGTTNESLKKIYGRKTPILGQIETQTNTEAAYHKMAEETQAKKAEVQKLLTSQ